MKNNKSIGIIRHSSFTFILLVVYEHYLRSRNIKHAVLEVTVTVAYSFHSQNHPYRES